MAGSRIVIGIDFGTTYSGVAYCDEEGKGQGTSGIQIIDSWPGVSQLVNEKVPTRIAYGPLPQRDIQWGNQIKPNTKYEVHSLMKLKLDEEELPQPEKQLVSLFTGLGLNHSDQPATETPLPNTGEGDMNVVNVVAEYLSRIREHTWVALAKQYGQGGFDSLRKELVVTVPAVWSEKAKDKTMRAVRKAMFDAEKVFLVTEPEAAAVYTLKGIMESSQKSELSVGDVFVLCDAGGGTVDLISYQITQTSPTFLIEEAAVGSGDKCGASYVDKEFLAWLKQWIGEERYNKIPKEKACHGAPLLTSFEQNKCHFSGSEDDFTITLPKECGIEDDEELNIDERVLTMRTDQMVQIFEPCVKRTIELIDGQVEAVMARGLAKPKMVFVVGGFGRNAYLYKRIGQYCATRDIEVRQPKFPWSAVARGAVCRGLEGTQGGLIAVRLARKHYGTLTSWPFIRGQHDVRDMCTNEFTGVVLANNQMSWLCKKGERLPEGEPKTMSIAVSFCFYENKARYFVSKLFGCSEDNAPARYTRTNVKTLCRVLADVSDEPLSEFTKLRSPNGRVYWQVDLTLAATFLSGEIEWKVLHKGKQIRKASVSYDN